MNKRIVLSKTPRQTENIAGDIAELIRMGGTVALYGELGSGKTTFAKGLAKKLGVKERIISPTFLIIRVHRTIEERSFYHIDLYRISKKEDLDSLGLEEILSNEGNIVVIEWAEKIIQLLPEKRIDVHFEYKSENERMIEVNAK